MPQSVTLCVINFNGEEFLSETLDAVRAHGAAFSETLLVDNSSTDSSLRIVRERCPEMRIVPLSENTGPGSARNVGFEQASHDYILFLDNDVMLGDGCVEELLGALLSHHNAAVAMPRVVYANEPETIQYEGADSHFLGVMTLRSADAHVSQGFASVRTVGSVVSACLLVDRRLCGAGKPFDEDFFIYLEDHDFGLRVRSQGRDILVVPTATCLHGTGTAGLSTRRMGRYTRERAFFVMRNRWVILAKYYRMTTLLRLAPALLVFEVVQLFGAISKGWFGAWLRAVWWMGRHCWVIVSKRRAVQRCRTVSDWRLLSGGAIPVSKWLVQRPSERWARTVVDRYLIWYWNRVAIPKRRGVGREQR